MIASLVLFLPLLIPHGTGAVPTAPVASPEAGLPIGAAAPEIWFALPNSGEELDPVLIVGTDFGDGLPFFGIVPSVPLFSLESPPLPLVGRVSLMVTAVPFTFFGGTVDLTVVRGLRVSNAVPFTIL